MIIGTFSGNWLTALRINYSRNPESAIARNTNCKFGSLDYGHVMELGYSNP